MTKSSTHKTVNPRAVAAQILAQVLQHGRSLTSVLANPPTALTSDPGLIKEFCFGTLRWYFQLTAIAKLLLRKPLKAKDSDIFALVLLGFYQLMHMRIPQHAAVGETVNAARFLQKPWAVSMLNGILRQFLRNQESLLQKTSHSPTASYAHPTWLITQLQNAWPDTWQQILTANNAHPPLTIRCNFLKTSRDTYLQRLAQQQITANPTPFTISGITLTQAQDVISLPGFAAGEISVQDGAAQLAAPLLELAPGLRVLDACAAPGGKTAHMLELQPELQLTAVDNDPERLEKVRVTLQRLHLTAQLIAADVSQTTEWWDGHLFDRILIDAPCSATGVIRRHPDIKLLRRNSDIADLVKQQAKILDALWPLLKPNGLAVYATCSILPQENHLQLEQFLAKHPDAKEQRITANWGHAVSIGRQILPGEATMDGFYYACLKKQ